MSALKQYGDMDLRLKKRKKQKKLKNMIFFRPMFLIMVTLCLIFSIQSLLVYIYRRRTTDMYLEERKAVLDSYYLDKGFEGYYTEESQVQLQVYHMVLKGDKILFPFKEYEEESRWELIEEIAQKRKKKEGETQGKIKHKGKIYYYKTLVYEGMEDGFFILKDTKNSVKYQVLLYMDITIIDQFATYINRGLMVVMTVVAILYWLLMKITIKEVSKSFRQLKGYIESVERKEGIISIKPLAFQEFDRIARALYKMQKKVQKAEQKQESYFQNASHELRTPLMSIQGYGEGILYDTLDDPKAAAEIIIRNSKKMSALVEEILFLSKMDMENSFSYHEVQVKKIIDKLVEECEAAEKTEGLEIDYKTEEENATIWGNGILLERAFGNVLSNGLRYAKSRINICIKSKDDYVVVVMENDGETISKEDLPYIFKRFYKGKGGVSGIGLAITKEAVEKMKGKVWVEEAEKMTRFCFLFPRMIK